MLITRTAFSQNSDNVDVTIKLPGKISKFSIIAFAEVLGDFIFMNLKIFSHT